MITQYQPRSLHTHLAYGRPWDLDRKRGGLTLLHPYQGHTGMRWYSGAADAVYQNKDFVHHHQAQEVLVLAGDQVYIMDLNPLIAQHHQARADATVASVMVNREMAQRCTTITVDQAGWITALTPPRHTRHQPEHPHASSALAVMGVILFSTAALNWRINEDQADSSSTHSLIGDLIPRMIRSGDRVLAYQHTDYWNPVYTIRDYWQAEMALLNERPSLNLQDEGWPIHTRTQARPPTRVEMGARVSHSLLSGGCIIEGTVEYSILSPGVYVGPGAIVRGAIVMQNSTIEECARVQNAILDMQVTVGQQAQVGVARRLAPTTGPKTLPPITVVDKGAHIHTGAIVEPHHHQDRLLVHTPQPENANNR